MSERYVFHFGHIDGTVTFGPYENWREAKAAFQRRYGYWPEILLGSDLYVRGDA